MATLLEKTRQINRLLQVHEIDSEVDLPYHFTAEKLGDIIDCNAYIIDEKGNVLGYSTKYDGNNERVNRYLAERKLPDYYVRLVDFLFDPSANIKVDEPLTIYPSELREQFPNGLTTIIPIFVASVRLGSFILSREVKEFGDDDLILAEMASTVVGMQLLNAQTQDLEESVRKQTAVNMAINTLSFSELKAVEAILNALEGDEGRLTASVVADEIGITRSVIVNALRKLESAGIIESRSLGMKGTYLKVINKEIYKKINHNDK
ncbi:MULTISPECIES: GTP-sensing pleiotropic transcriptional regulator CodY [unclassified Enterococcus]|uniref:GTP-sensing pleiotropic transcriptional regulator CodY n=1 Tax=unclassified Enterococcus TaxID=2608891 RepID=UPI001554AE35|nr:MULTISPECIES: GTP-sensing pleiotropic transcriptional regulator CodY [unclassified Enterococcus]MBS7576554.1 GTP-sensing pleiotropic transcriptional regulator CodY [Enterococcus sp. MMGLQ5-2]MBS7583959.1 GTP-sensing pleiotropic transcriptional regulator CodY [Enterococcus sp. MMGLQ5-1]NPD11820.1 GTP-sensing pleiotropic transcriptional regulator CodY [Enterococcus sp. MMGLQ5-1]NPD36391.1 GTP-sensing pleiotropic transcriptional regulator CodY [Enterococcus sp. MMGLQ5-2]